MTWRPHRMTEVTDAAGRKAGVIRVDPCLCGRKDMQTGVKCRLPELLTDKPFQF